MESRYQYQKNLPGWGEEGQDRLNNSHVSVVGAGGLGSWSAPMLVRAGVKTITIYDPDIVDETNLHRQNYTQRQALTSKSKVSSLAEHLKSINIAGNYHERPFKFIYKDALTLSQYDIVIDGIDNWDTKFLLNDGSKRSGVPLVYGGISGVQGMVHAVLPKTEKGETPWEAEGIHTYDLREIFGDIPEYKKKSHNNGRDELPGILAPMLPIVANIQVIEALKILTRNYHAVNQDLLSINGWAGQYRSLQVRC